MPWEYGLMAQGHEEAQTERRRQEAVWVAYLITAQGKPVTAAQLLGEETPEETEEQKLAAGERRIAEIKRKLKRKKKR